MFMCSTSSLELKKWRESRAKRFRGEVPTTHHTQTFAEEDNNTNNIEPRALRLSHSHCPTGRNVEMLGGSSNV